MRLVIYDELQLKLREYADKKAANGEIELANGILKAKCFIDQECKIINNKQLNGGWIPVSERLPKALTFVLVTVKHKDNSLGVMHAVRINSCIFGWLLGDIEAEVIAWQPLPQPYMDKVDKNIPVKVKSYNDIKICPTCENTVHSIYNYCCHCGQKFDKEGV